MISFTLKLSKQDVKNLQKSLKSAEHAGDYQKIRRLLSIRMLGNKQLVSEVADLLGVSGQSVRQWLIRYLHKGIRGLNSGKRAGRPPKLTKTQRRELYNLLMKLPEELGFTGSCWRTPMIQRLIQERFNVFYNVHYISEFLKSMGLSYQKAAFIASKRDAEKRQAWLKETWPEILTLAERSNAYLLFGDEASFPQWGSLSYTWAPIGKQPVVKTSGSRRGYKVFGLIDYFTGRVFAKGHEGRLNGESYTDFLRSVLSETRKHIILIQDGAPYHKGKIVKDFFERHKKRLTVYNLPSYSPDYNPIEMLWKKIKEQGTHLKYFPTFDDLKNKVNQMLDFFKKAKDEVLALFGFYEGANAS